MLAINTGLQDAWRPSLHGILIEGDSFCVLWWAWGQVNTPRFLANILVEVMDLANRLSVSVNHIKQSDNADAYRLAKEGIHEPNIVLFFDTSAHMLSVLCIFVCYFVASVGLLL